MGIQSNMSYIFIDLKYLKSFIEIHRPDSAKDRCFYLILGLSKTLVIGRIERQKIWQRNTQLQRECSNRLWMKTGTVSGSENPRKWTCSIYKLEWLYRQCISTLMIEQKISIFTWFGIRDTVWGPAMWSLQVLLVYVEYCILRAMSEMYKSNVQQI